MQGVGAIIGIAIIAITGRFRSQLVGGPGGWHLGTY